MVLQLGGAKWSTRYVFQYPKILLETLDQIRHATIWSLDLIFSNFGFLIHGGFQKLLIYRFGCEKSEDVDIGCVIVQSYKIKTELLAAFFFFSTLLVLSGFFGFSKHQNVGLELKQMP